MKRIFMCIISSVLLWSAQLSSPRADENSTQTQKKEGTLAPAQSGDPSTAHGRKTALTANIVLKVVQLEKVRESILTETKNRMGFPLLITDESTVLKIPPEEFNTIIALASEKGWLIEKTFTRQDITKEIGDLKGRLKSKREILTRLRAFFDESDVAATLHIEQKMNQIVLEIEQVKGNLRLLEDRARFAVLNIAFQFQNRDRIIDKASPFEWVNTVDLNRFVTEF